MEKVFGKVEVMSIKPHAFKPELGSAELHQVVQTLYPARKTNNDLFTEDELKLEVQVFESERVFFMDIPKTFTIKQVQARVAKFPDLTIKRTLANAPLMSADDISAKKAGVITEEQWLIMQAKQIVKNKEGEVVTPNSPIFRRYSLSTIKVEDEDLRTTIVTPVEQQVTKQASAVSKEQVSIPA